LSAWLPSRLFRGSSDALGADCGSEDPNRLHMAVARAGPTAPAPPPTTSPVPHGASSRSPPATGRARS